MLLFRSSALCIALVLCGALHAAPASAKNPPRASGQHNSADLVDINRANLDELMKVPGITRVWAERIVRFRPYRTKLDLMQEGIIPGSVYGKIKDAIIAHHPKQ
ncbi:MAG: ComEA family DNA-binding protein [Acidobacteriota bacterium]